MAADTAHGISAALLDAGGSHALQNAGGQTASPSAPQAAGAISSVPRVFHREIVQRKNG